MKTITLFFQKVIAIFCCLLSVVSFGQTTLNVRVPGTSNPWLAGMPDGTTASEWESDVAPGQSPVLLKQNLSTINYITFSEITGGVAHSPRYPLVGPDGCTSFEDCEFDPLISHSLAAEHGKSDLTAPINSLVGVFLDGEVPSGAAPEKLDFSTPAARDYSTLRPKLKQVFFIGDGKTSAGTQQRIVVPDGATRLFLGTMDGDQWVNNMGVFNVSISYDARSSLNSFSLINADKDQVIGELSDGDILNLTGLPSTRINIRANTNPATVGSVVFSLNEQQARSHTENNAPYALFANKGGDYYAWTPANGSYTLTATPYSAANGGGTTGNPLTIRFQVVHQVVNSFTLVNADTDQEIGELKDGAVINLSTLPAGTKINIKANINPARVGSVVFDIKLPAVFTHIENIAPYTLMANKGQDYDGIIPPVGNYTLTATPYSGTKGSGYKGKGYTINFSVVNNPSTTRIEQRPLTGALATVGSLSAAPNPTRGQSSISFSVPQTEYTVISIMDYKGAKVGQLFSAPAVEGKVYTVPFDGKHLGNGVYVLQLVSGTYKQSIQLVLVQ